MSIMGANQMGIDADHRQSIILLLQGIHQKIDCDADEILGWLQIFRDPQNLIRSAPSLEDITKVGEGCKLLKRDSARLLLDNIQKPNFFEENENIEDYLSKARHDLRNPLNIILGYTEILSEEFQGDKDKDLVEALTHMRGCIERITNAINSIKWTEGKHVTGSPKKDELITEFIEKNVESQEFIKFKEDYSILIVDDIRENCMILERYLHRLGYKQVRQVYDGLQAIDILKTQKVNLILLDVDMPNMNGIDVLMELKEDIIERRVMVLMISAADTMENTIRCIQLGAEDFLPKPFNSDLLKVRIGSCVEKSWYVQKESVYLEKIELERERYKKLLHSIFPPAVVDELTKTGKVQTRNYQNVAIIFADIVGFTSYCDQHDLSEIIVNMQGFVDICETAVHHNNLQKIKTIGDCFLAVSGLLMKSDNPVLDCIDCAEEILSKLNALPSKWQLRVGINFGTLLGGIVGHRQYLFDIWGDAVNTASRIQTLAEANTIYLSKSAWEQVKDYCESKALGKMSVKGKPPMEVFSYLRKK